MTTPTMIEVLAEHAYGAGSQGRYCQCGAMGLGDRQANHAEHVARVLAAAGFGHVASVEAERHDDRCESEYESGAHAWTPCGCWAERAEAEGLVRRAEAAEAQVATLQRWKDEAVPVMFGLQDLGRALDLPPGERITGERALEAVQALVKQVATARREAARDALNEAADDFQRQWPVYGDDWLRERAARLGGEGER